MADLFTKSLWTQEVANTLRASTLDHCKHRALAPVRARLEAGTDPELDRHGYQLLELCLLLTDHGPAQVQGRHGHLTAHQERGVHALQQLQAETAAGAWPSFASEQNCSLPFLKRWHTVFSNLFFHGTLVLEEVKLRFVDAPGDSEAAGLTTYGTPARIYVFRIPGQSIADYLTTLLHEMVHAFLHIHGCPGCMGLTACAGTTSHGLAWLLYMLHLVPQLGALAIDLPLMRRSAMLGFGVEFAVSSRVSARHITVGLLKPLLKPLGIDLAHFAPSDVQDFVTHVATQRARPAQAYPDPFVNAPGPVLLHFGVGSAPDGGDEDAGGGSGAASGRLSETYSGMAPRRRRIISWSRR